MPHPRLDRVHRWSAAACLLVAPPIGFAIELYNVANHLPRNIYDLSRAAGPLGFALMNLQPVADLLWIPGLLGLAHRVRGRFPRLALLAAVLCAFGAASMLVNDVVAQAFFRFAEAGATRDLLARAGERWFGSTTAAWTWPGYFFGLGGGMLLLTLLLWAARAAPRGAVAAVWLALAIFFGPFPTVSTAVAHGLLVIAFGWMAVHLLRLSPAEWAGDELSTSPIPIHPPAPERVPAGRP